MERRERLRKLMAALDEETVADAFEALGPGMSIADVAPTKEVFYTEGPETLLDARTQVRCGHMQCQQTVVRDFQSLRTAHHDAVLLCPRP